MSSRYLIASIFGIDLLIAWVMQTMQVAWPWILSCLLIFTVVSIVWACHHWPRLYLSMVTWVISRVLFRFSVVGGAHIPSEGPAILACNHVSYVDVPLIMAAIKRPVVFLVHFRMFTYPGLGDFLRLAQAIPIATKQQDLSQYEAGLNAAVEALRQGHLLAIFPEGRITNDGSLQSFKNGLLKVLHQVSLHGVVPPVIPIALHGLWGNYFSRFKSDRSMLQIVHQSIFCRVELRVGESINPPISDLEQLRKRVAQLLQ
jgi:1-acyl-sn-glycerol-3-phosphate acyltransferase